MNLLNAKKRFCAFPLCVPFVLSELGHLSISALAKRALSLSKVLDVRAAARLGISLASEERVDVR